MPLRKYRSVEENALTDVEQAPGPDNLWRAGDVSALAARLIGPSVSTHRRPEEVNGGRYTIAS